MTQPTHGTVEAGGHRFHVHAKTLDHMPEHTAYARFNKHVAIAITRAVGSMTCAYIFCLLALCSLPYVLSQFSMFAHTFPAWLIKLSILTLIAWIAQTFLQLVLLSVIIVGQNIQSTASDARAAKTFDDTEALLESMNLTTPGGLKDHLDATLAALETLRPPALAKPSPAPTPPKKPAKKVVKKATPTRKRAKS